MATKKAMKAAIIEALQVNGDLVRASILELAARQTEDELESKDTKHKNRRGFSSSNAYWGTRYAEMYTRGEALSSDDMERARRICIFHAKQLAAITLS